MRDGNRYRSVFNIMVWGGPDHVPNAQLVLQLAAEKVVNALWLVDCILLGNVDVDVRVPGHSDLQFTLATFRVEEA